VQVRSSLLCQQRQGAKLASGLLYSRPLLRNNITATNFQMFTSSQDCQIGFFEANIHKFGFFRGSWRQKKLFGFLAFSFQYLAFSGDSWHMTF